VGVSQEALVHEARITTNYYGQLEHGKKSSALKAILEALPRLSIARRENCSPISRRPW
jgi:predicted transcriptional regulator